MKLPNGKALSRQELIDFRHQESGGAAAFRKKVNDLSILWAILLYAAVFLVGSLVRVFSTLEVGLPANLFRAIVVICLALSTFYTYLDIDFAASKRKITATVQSVVYGWMLFRWAVGIGLIFSGVLYQSPDDLYKVLCVLFWMVPPALTSPVLSILWGGNLYPSAVLSRTISIVAPVAMIGTFLIAGSQLPINMSSLGFFFVILTISICSTILFEN